MSEKAAESPRLLKWSGFVLVVGGVLLAVATPLHPSRETATTIIASEVRLVASHVLSTLSSLLVLLGLPGLYVAQRAGMGQLGFVGFFGAFTGTYLLAVSGNFGFLAPVLAKESPEVIDAINLYPPELGLNALAVITFVVGYALFGIAMTRTTLPRPVRHLGCRGCSGLFARRGHLAARLPGRLGDRRLGQRQSRGRAGLGWLSALAHNDRLGLRTTCR